MDPFIAFFAGALVGGLTAFFTVWIMFVDDDDLPPPAAGVA